MNRPAPPPVAMRFPAAVHAVYKQLVIAIAAGASLGFGVFAIALNPENPFAWASVGVGAGTAMMNLLKGPKLAGRFAFFCGRIDGAYRMIEAEYRADVEGATQVVLDMTEDPTYPDEEG